MSAGPSQATDVKRENSEELCPVGKEYDPQAWCCTLGVPELGGQEDGESKAGLKQNNNSNSNNGNYQEKHF